MKTNLKEETMETEKTKEEIQKEVAELKERNFKCMEENMRLKKLVQAQAEVLLLQLK